VTPSRRALPPGWTSTSVAEIADSIQYGFTASAAKSAVGVRFLRITDIQRGGVAWGTVPSCEISEAETAKYQLAEGDIVFARTGATTGKSFLIGPCPLAVFASYLIRLRVNEEISARYVHAYFQSGEYWQQIQSAKRGVGQPNVNGQVLGQVGLVLPPLPEQRRIVSELEQQLSRLDAAVEALRRAQRNLQRFRDSVLKAACEGKLVPTEAELARREGREYEPASALLQRILAERRRRWEEAELAKLRAKGKEPTDSKWKAKYKEPAVPKTDGLPVLPEGWCWASLGLVCEVRGGIQKQPSRRPDKNPHPFLRVANVHRGRLDLREIHKIELFPGEAEVFALRRGDLLIVEGNGSPSEIGRMALWDGSVASAVHQNHIIRARPLDGLSGIYAAAFWNSPEGSRRVLSLSGSSSGLHTLSVSSVSELPIPLPPHAEQQRIAVELEQRTEESERLAAQVARALVRTDRLRQSLLREAFSGGLVPQDPNDEPASALLARIRAERDAASREKKSSPSSRRGRKPKPEAEAAQCSSP